MFGRSKGVAEGGEWAWVAEAGAKEGRETELAAAAVAATAPANAGT